jgi:hypothetical protein
MGSKIFSRANVTPNEFHAKWAFPPTAKCCACQAKPSIRAIVMMPIDEAEKRGLIPPGAATAPMLFPAVVPVLVPIREPGNPKPSFYIRVSMVYSCRRCRKDLAKALAKAPSFCIVEINEGPNPNERVLLGSS